MDSKKTTLFLITAMLLLVFSPFVIDKAYAASSGAQLKALPSSDFVYSVKFEGESSFTTVGTDAVYSDLIFSRSTTFYLKITTQGAKSLEITRDKDGEIESYSLIIPSYTSTTELSYTVDDLGYSMDPEIITLKPLAASSAKSVDFYTSLTFSETAPFYYPDIVTGVKSGSAQSLTLPLTLADATAFFEATDLKNYYSLNGFVKVSDGTTVSFPITDPIDGGIRPDITLNTKSYTVSVGSSADFSVLASAPVFARGLGAWLVNTTDFSIYTQSSAPISPYWNQSSEQTLGITYDSFIAPVNGSIKTGLFITLPYLKKPSKMFISAHNGTSDIYSLNEVTPVYSFVKLWDDTVQGSFFGGGVGIAFPEVSGVEGFLSAIEIYDSAGVLYIDLYYNYSRDISLYDGFGFFGRIFSGTLSMLNIYILPGISLGLILSAILGLGVLMFVFKLIGVF